MVETSPHGSGGVLSHINPTYDDDEDGSIENNKVVGLLNLGATDQFTGYPLSIGLDTNGEQATEESGTFSAGATTLGTQVVTLSQTYNQGIAQAFFTNTALSPVSDAKAVINSYSLGTGEFTVLFDNTTASAETVEWRFIGR